ncbi:glutathione peroxidase [soil metagenome]
MPNAHSFTVKTITGESRSLEKYHGKVMLIVNVASQCGLTPQYAGLEKLHDELAGKGLAILGFPANEFGAQEPGTNGDIKTFCETKFGVKFDMFEKVKVKGDGIDPLFAYLTNDSPFTGEIKWNFAKFLVGKDGAVVARFEPTVAPDAPELRAAIDKALAS